MVDSLGYPPISSTMVSPFHHNVCFSITLKKIFKFIQASAKEVSALGMKTLKSLTIETHKNL